MLLSDLLSNNDIYGTADPKEIRILSVCDNTRDLLPGALFIARKGDFFSPADHLHEIEESGAAALLLAHNTPLPSTSIPCFYTEDIRACGEKIFETYYKNPAKDLRLFAVTGTNGKTSTALILTHFFEASGIKSGYIGTLGAHLGGKIISEANGITTPDTGELYAYLRQFADAGVKNVVMDCVPIFTEWYTARAVHRQK